MHASNAAQVPTAHARTTRPAGLERQLSLCDSGSPPAWCDDSQLVSQLRTALDRLWSTIVNNADVAFSEVRCTW